MKPVDYCMMYYSLYAPELLCHLVLVKIETEKKKSSVSIRSEPEGDLF